MNAEENGVSGARQLLTAGDARAAFTALRAAAPRVELDAGFVDLFTDVLRQLGGADEAALGERLRARFEDADAAVQVGLRLLEAGIEELAIPFLGHCLQLEPLEPLPAIGLAQAWASLLAPERGVEAMKAQLGRQGFEADLEWWLRFHMSSLLAGAPDEGLPRFCAQVRRQVEQGGIDDAGYAEHVSLAVEELQAAFARWVAATDKSTEHIRPWHFIQYGGAVLLTAPAHGSTAAAGRFGMLQLSAPAVAEIVRHLVELLEAAGRTTTCVVPTPGKDAAIVAHLAARLLGVPVTLVPDDQPLPEGALVAAADAQNLLRETDFERPTWRTRLRRRAGEVGLFALCMDWRAQAPFCPDAVGVLAQRAVLPWSGGAVSVDPTTGRGERVPEDERSAEEIADALLRLDPTASPEWPAALTAYKAQIRHAGVTARIESVRGPFVKDSPVAGSYFL
jgi:hypothetical protein